MQRVKDTIEVLIEESYLRTLSEGELDAELGRFVHTCKVVIGKNIRDLSRRRRLQRRITAIHATTLRSDVGPRSLLQALFGKHGERQLKREEKVKRVAGIKRTIMKAIEEYEPQLVFFIEHDVSLPPFSPQLLEETERPKETKQRERWMLIGIGCVALGALILLVLLW